MEPPPRPAVILIAAVARNRGIGRNNQLLVHLPGDLPRFKCLTLGHVVVMGRKTWDSIGRPLPQRRNIVLTRDPDWRAEGAEAVPSLDEAMALAAGGGALKVFVIGGAEIYALAMERADELVLTEIDADLEADAYFPEWPRGDFRQTAAEARLSAEGLAYRHATYTRI